MKLFLPTRGQWGKECDWRVYECVVLCLSGTPCVGMLAWYIDEYIVLWCIQLALVFHYPCLQRHLVFIIIIHNSTHFIISPILACYLHSLCEFIDGMRDEISEQEYMVLWYYIIGTIKENEQSFSISGMEDSLDMKVIAFSWKWVEGESCIAREAKVTLRWLQCLMPWSFMFSSALSVGLSARRQAAVLNMYTMLYEERIKVPGAVLTKILKVCLGVNLNIMLNS